MTEPRHNQHFQVTAALIRREDGRFLIARRPSTAIHGGLWEFPGGKLEDGESLENCLEREIGEELALAVRVGRRLASVDQEYAGFGITLHLFECRVAAGAEAPPDGYRIRWVRGRDLHRFSLPEADRKLVSMLGDEL